jgi:hypothetical protein
MSVRLSSAISFLPYNSFFCLHKWILNCNLAFSLCCFIAIFYLASFLTFYVKKDFTLTPKHTHYNIYLKINTGQVIVWRAASILTLQTTWFHMSVHVGCKHNDKCVSFVLVPDMARMAHGCVTLYNTHKSVLWHTLWFHTTSPSMLRRIYIMQNLITTA